MDPAILCNYRQKTPSRIAKMFLNKNGQPGNSKPKPRESALKPPGSIVEPLENIHTLSSIYSISC
jgi:hypothetical protein